MTFYARLSKPAIAIVSGLLLVLAFPKFSLYPLSLVALVPLVVVSFKEPRPLRRFLYGFLAGIVFFSGICYWIYTVMKSFGGLGAVAAGGVFIIFCITLAAYFGLFVWLSGYLWKLSWGPAVIPLLWISLELARAHLLTGFPWLLLGYAATDFAALARVARWTGVYGLSYLIISINVGLAWLWLRRKDKSPRLFLAAHTTIILAISLTASRQDYPVDRKVFLVQTQIPQELALEPWNYASQQPLIERLEQLTLRRISPQEPPALIVYPEMPAHFYYWDDLFTRPFFKNLARRTNSFLVTGIVAFKHDADGSHPLNSALLLNPSGDFVSQHDKLHLVPFGEYVPLKEWLWFANALTGEVSDFVPGEKIVISPILGGHIGSLICYEAIFPNLTRQFARDGAEVLVNISNDGWYGSSAARYQHLLMSRMRAIENGRYLLRSTNTGLTAVIRPDGSIAAELPPDRPAVLEARWGLQTEQTIYTRYGDWFPRLCAVLSLLALIAAWRRPSEYPRSKS